MEGTEETVGNRLCYACHKLWPAPDDESDTNEGKSDDDADADDEDWRCLECLQLDKPTRDFLDPERILEETQQFLIDNFKEDKDTFGLWASAPCGGENCDGFTLLDFVAQGKQVLTFFIISKEQDDCDAQIMTKEDLMKHANSDKFLSLSSLAIKTTAQASMVLDSLDKNSEYVDAIAHYCDEHPGDLVMIVIQPTIVERHDGKTGFYSLVLIDVIPALDPSTRLGALQFGFMTQLAQYTIDKSENPKGQEGLCIRLYGAFKLFRRRHLDCKVCCPTKKDRRNAKAMFDKDTATILTSECCGTDRFDKILHVDLFWPCCLPEDRQENLDWLEDPAERVRIMKQVEGDPDGMKVQYKDQLLDCATGGKRDNPNYYSLNETIDELARNEYLFTVHFGLNNSSRVCLWSRRYQFRKPAVIVHHDGSIKLDLKKCAYCDKEEKVSLTFSKCSRCKDVCYCCKAHQEAHWKTHKSICVRKAEKQKK